MSSKSPKNHHGDGDDINLFKDEVTDVKPFEHDKVTHRNITKKATQPKYQQQRLEQSLKSNFSDIYEPDMLGSEETIQFRRSGIQHRLFSRLRTGQIPIEAELDLHGMTVAIALHNLAKFFQDCREDKLRCIRIVHGKGWSSKDQKPVLKTKINTWLQQDDDVLAFCSAPIHDGGTGAVYVLLRRIKFKEE